MVLNRLQYALLKEATSVVEEGVATAEDVDTIVRTTFGFRLGFFGPFAIADQAGLDVYANCFVTFEDAFGDRLSTPQILTDSVAADRKGVKNGKGLLGDYDEETAAELVAYRNKAYAKMSHLLAELGPAPQPATKNDGPPPPPFTPRGHCPSAGHRCPGPEPNARDPRTSSGPERSGSGLPTS